MDLCKQKQRARVFYYYLWIYIYNMKEIKILLQLHGICGVHTTLYVCTYNFSFISWYNVHSWTLASSLVFPSMHATLKSYEIHDNGVNNHHQLMFMPTFDLGCTSGIYCLIPCCWFSTITVIVATPTQRKGCGLPIVVVLQVDAINIDLKEVSTGGVKPSHRQVDAVHLLKCRENTCAHQDL